MKEVIIEEKNSSQTSIGNEFGINNSFKHRLKECFNLNKIKPKSIGGIEQSSVRRVVSYSLESALNSFLSNWSFQKQLGILGIEISDLVGSVLDIGSGESELFSKGASVHGIKVDSVNPQLVNKGDRQAAQSSSGRFPWQRRSVAALASNLPFKEDAYDTVVSVYAVPHWIPLCDTEKALDEIIRVLKPGGRAYLSPIGKKGFSKEGIRVLLEKKADFCRFFIDEGYSAHSYSRLVITKLGAVQ